MINEPGSPPHLVKYEFIKSIRVLFKFTMVDHFSFLNKAPILSACCKNVYYLVLPYLVSCVFLVCFNGQFYHHACPLLNYWDFLLIFSMERLQHLALALIISRSFTNHLRPVSFPSAVVSLCSFHLLISVMAQSCLVPSLQNFSFSQHCFGINTFAIPPPPFHYSPVTSTSFFLRIPVAWSAFYSCNKLLLM